MVKSESYTCNICDKMYSSASSLCNHRTKKHKVQNNSIEQHNNSIEQHNNSIEPKITAIKSEHFNCRICDKSYKHQQSRSRHEIICKTKNNNSIREANINIETQNNKSIREANINIETQNNKSIREANINIETQNIQNNNTNNGTINTTNNITINNYGDENKAFVSEAFMLKIISNIIKNDDKITEVIPHLIRNIHFNPHHKNNNNIKINNIRSPTAKVYKDKKWIYVDKKKMLNETHDKSVKFTENWAEEHKEKVPEDTKDKIKDYKQIHSKQYHNKKKILDEITKLAYIYYKNYMEGELELDD